jgi:hypothetical protein
LGLISSAHPSFINSTLNFVSGETPAFKGPEHKKSYTDVICLILFVIFIGAWIALGIYGEKKYH